MPAYLALSLLDLRAGGRTLRLRLGLDLGSAGGFFVFGDGFGGIPLSFLVTSSSVGAMAPTLISRCLCRQTN